MASNLVVIGFDDYMQAEKVRIALEQMEEEQLIKLEDAVVAAKHAQGRVKIRQEQDFLGGTAIGGGLLGLIVGAVLLHPVIGGAFGVLAGKLFQKDIGIDDVFISDVSSALKPGSSALFLLVQEAEVDKVLERLQPYKGRVLQTTLPDDVKERVNKALS